MYIGRIVAIVPKPGFENDMQKNPYIAYDCLRLANGYAIVTNGSQTDPILPSSVSCRTGVGSKSPSTAVSESSVSSCAFCICGTPSASAAQARPATWTWAFPKTHISACHIHCN